MIKHIHILGASGSGTTTLAEAIESELGYKHFDTDKYYWLPSEPPFEKARNVEDRIKLLEGDLSVYDRWVLSGSLCGWGDLFIDEFDLVIYLRIPKDIRMERLRLREEKRNGTRILEGNDLYLKHKNFMEWAAKYDEGGLEIRSKKLHYDWLKKLKCKVLKIEENITLDQKMNLIKEILD